MPQIPLEEADFQKLKSYILNSRPYLHHKTVKISLQEMADKVGFQHFWFDSVYFRRGYLWANTDLRKRTNELPPKVAHWFDTRKPWDMEIELNTEDLVDPIATGTTATTDASGSSASASGATGTAETSENADAIGVIGYMDTAEDTRNKLKRKASETEEEDTTKSSKRKAVDTEDRDPTNTSERNTIETEDGDTRNKSKRKASETEN
jgi:hypothetical protein